MAEQTESVEESTEHFSVEQELEEMFLAAEEDNMTSSLDVVYAEEEMYPELAQFLAEYYQIPEEDWERTRYYYNYIDLNEDGTDEIFAVVLTDITKGNPGGSPAIILEQDDAGAFTVLESFEEIATPGHGQQQCHKRMAGHHLRLLRIKGWRRIFNLPL